jgi:type I restriction enzyme S subunit
MDLTDCGWISRAEHERIYARCDVRRGDLLLTKDGANTGNAAINPLAEEFSLLSSVALIRCDEKLHHARFVLQYLLSPLGQQRIKDLMSGNAITRLTVEKIKAFEIPVPGPEEQRQIADILEAVDEAIGQTESLIAKLQKIKAGLLHDLLTRGIDENGELRDPVSSSKKLTVGDDVAIPQTWIRTDLGSVGNWHAGGTPSKAVAKYWGGSIPWLTPKDMKVFRIEETTDYLTTIGAASGTCLVPPDAVFIVVRGMILAHTFPVCISSKAMTFNQDIRAITDSGSAEMMFLAYWLVGNSWALLRLATEATHGTKRLDMNEVRRCRIALPPRPEQKEIVGRLLLQDERIDGEMRCLEKLRALKPGLMHDLLTGNVRLPARAAAT